MFAANTYSIHTATDDDTSTLRTLAERNGQQPFTGPALIGTTATGVTAAISLDDGRVISDGSPTSGHLVANLRSRAAAANAHDAMPSTRERMLAGYPAWLHAVSTPVWKPATTDEPALAIA